MRIPNSICVVVVGVEIAKPHLKINKRNLLDKKTLSKETRAPAANPSAEPRLNHLHEAKQLKKKTLF